MNGFFIFLGLLVAYIGVVYLLNRSGRLGGSLELMGPFLMMRTQRGKPTIEKISKAKRLWAVFGDAGIVMTVIAGLLMLAMLFLQVLVIASRPQEIAERAPPVEYLVGLPGVNPLIPLWYGLFALVVALVIHEGCHGILSRHAGIRVKSLGLLWFVVPIGAFVEPDEVDLERASTRERLRMFAAGPMSNLVVAIVTGIVFSSLFMGSLAPVNDGEGVIVTEVSPGRAAEAAGITTGSIITHVNGTPIKNGSAFTRALAGIHYDPDHPPTATFTVLQDGQARDVQVTFRESRYEAERAARAERGDTTAPNASLRERVYMGVSVYDMASIARVRDVLASPFSYGFGGFFSFIYYPFFVLSEGVDVMNAPYSDYMQVTGPLGGMPEPLFFLLANAVYWLFWLNLMLGTFNAIPAGPLDGGQMLRATTRSLLWRAYGVDRTRTRVERNPDGPGVQVLGNDDDTQARLDRAHGVLRRTTKTIGFTILALILLPVLAPPLIRLFG